MERKIIEVDTFQMNMVMIKEYHILVAVCGSKKLASDATGHKYKFIMLLE